MTQATIQPITKDSAEAQSADLAQGSLAQLKTVFPEAFTEENVDFEVLKQLLGAAVDEREEKYGLNWHGKRRARQLAMTPSTGTLRPCPEESVDWDTTQNLFVEGDNLEVLKLLQKSYAGKVKLIYIDPPYNTGKDFVYPDNFQDSIKNYLELTGQVESGQKISSNSEASGRFHTDWLNMMYPRLKLSHGLLRRDGIICVSINDKEQANLKALMNEVFGEENFLAQLIWDKNHSAQAGIFKVYHEYVLVYCKSTEGVKPIRASQAEDFEAGAMKRESARHPMQEFTFPAGTRFDAKDGIELKGSWGDAEKVHLKRGRMRAESGKLKDEVTLEAAFTQANQMQQYFYGDRESLVDSRGQRVLEFYFTSTGKLKVTKERGVYTPPSVQRWGMQGEISTELADLFECDAPPLETPKGLRMMRDLIEWFTGPNDIILDFFAGSGTTAHAAMEVSARAASPRKFILVQFPEPCPDGSLARSMGFKTIADLCRRRIVLAGNSIAADLPDVDADFGFRAFRLSSSNIRAWSPRPDDLTGTLLDHAEHLVPGRTEQDVMYELLLKLGLDLVVPMESRRIAGKTVHSIGAGVLFVCLSDGITRESAEPLALGIAEWQRTLAPASDSKLVFKDSAFVDDVAKSNLAAILSQHGLDDLRSL